MCSRLEPSDQLWPCDGYTVALARLPLTPLDLRFADAQIAQKITSIVVDIEGDACATELHADRKVLDRDLHSSSASSLSIRLPISNGWRAHEEVLPIVALELHPRVQGDELALAFGRGRAEAACASRPVAPELARLVHAACLCALG